MTLDRRSYLMIQRIIVNNRFIWNVIIDSHYRKNHSESINDDLILNLVKKLHGRYQFPEAQDGKYQYFVTLLEWESKYYRLVWLLEEQENYIGIINAFRDKKGAQNEFSQ